MDGVVELLNGDNISGPLSIISLMTALSFIPVVLIAMTCFTRFVIVFSLLRYALGLQQTPPNIVIIVLSLFMTLFSMSNTINQLDSEVITPYVEKSIEIGEAVKRSESIMKGFMLKHTNESDLAAMLEASGSNVPNSHADTNMLSLIPAFLLSELKTAFKIGFIIFIPFLLVDLIVSSILMSLGMIMLPPITISMPIKIMLFVLLDGWSLISSQLITSVVT